MTVTFKVRTEFGVGSNIANAAIISDDEIIQHVTAIAYGSTDDALALLEDKLAGAIEAVRLYRSNRALADQLTSAFDAVRLYRSNR